MARSLVVKLTCAANDAERANQALTVAAAAVALGTPVTLWLTGDAAYFGVEGADVDLRLDYATPADELLTSVLAGGEVVVCSQCAARRDIVEGDLREGASIKGAAVFAEQVLGDDVQALVY